MSSPSPTNAAQADEERFGYIRDYGGDAPHIRLIAPDNGLFIVSAKDLCDASPVFKAMVDTCTFNGPPATLELVDAPMECSLYVETILDRIMEGKPDLSHGDSVSVVINLAKKYECVEALRRIELEMYRKLVHRSHICDDSDSYVDVVISLQAWPLLGRIISDMEGHEEGCCYVKLALNLQTWTPDEVQKYNRNDPHYVWGMTQAAFETYDSATGTFDYKRMGRIFTVIMAEARKSDHYQPTQKTMREIAPLRGNEDGNKRRKVNNGRTAGS